MQKEIYATAAIFGIGAYLGLLALGVAAMAFVTGGAVVVALHILAIHWGLSLPVAIRRR